MTCPESQELFLASHHFVDEVVAMARIVRKEKEEHEESVNNGAVDIALDSINAARYY